MARIRLVAAAGLVACAVSPMPAGQKAHSAPANGPTPDQAWLMLREGNARYFNGKAEHPNADQSRRDEVAEGQNPFAVVLACADSRVPVERVFDRGIGDLFVVRVAGNVSDTDEVGTIEYGAGHLNSPLVVVMGHSACGAVKAVASGAEVHGSIPGLVDNIIPAVEWVRKNRPGLTGDELVSAAIEANVWQSIDDLFTKSEEVRGLVEANRLKVVGAVYDLASGRVRWLGEHPYQDQLLSAPAGLDEPHAENVPMPRSAAPAAAPKPMPAAPTEQAQKDTHEAPSPKDSTTGPGHDAPKHKTADAPTHGKGQDPH